MTLFEVETFGIKNILPDTRTSESAIGSIGGIGRMNSGSKLASDREPLPPPSPRRISSSVNGCTNMRKIYIQNAVSYRKLGKFEWSRKKRTTKIWNVLFKNAVLPPLDGTSFVRCCWKYIRLTLDWRNRILRRCVLNSFWWINLEVARRLKLA